MNDSRRAELDEVVDLIDEAIDRLDDIISDEQDSFDNLPEGLQCSRTGEGMERAIEVMEGFGSELEGVMGHIREFQRPGKVKKVSKT